VGEGLIPGVFVGVGVNVVVGVGVGPAIVKEYVYP
jgi:hypothetical protein